MSDLTPEERFEWLDAGRAMGDLSAEEEAEWRSLSATVGQDFSEEVSFDSIVCSLEESLSPSSSLPNGLVDKLREEAEPFHRQEDDTVIEGDFNSTNLGLSHPVWGWAAAVGFAILLGFSTKDDVEPPRLGSGEALVDEIVADPASVRVAFNLTDESPAGELVWSDTMQKGVMILERIPVNDPAKEQYQLWIVDSDRDDTHPVDGGVFDIPVSAEGKVYIPIDAKLPVDEPGVFVITLEQPGGVVVSKQDRVIAIASA